MQVVKLPISGLLLFKPNIYKDERGYFFESWNEELFKSNGVDLSFVQDNQSFSHKNVIRGLHFQNPPYAQGKLVRVIQGSVIDVAVDLRKKSSTYGQYYSVELSSKNNYIFWIPPGFAHGFATLEDKTIFSYKCTNVYNKKSEGSLIWNDVDLNIDWGIDDPIVSSKDMNSIKFNDLNSQF